MISFKKIQFWMGTTIIFAALFLGMFFSKDGWHRHDKSAWMSKLQITADQKAKIKDLYSNSRKQRKENRKQLRLLEEKFIEKMSSRNLSEEELRLLHQELIKANNESSQRRFENTLRIRKIIGTEKMREFYKYKHGGSWRMKSKISGH